MAKSRPPPGAQATRPTSPPPASSCRALKSRSDTHPPRLASPSSSRPATRSQARPRSLNSYFLKGCNQAICPGDCIFMRSDDATALPFVGKIKKIEAFSTGESDVTVLVNWYYRPEETVAGRQPFHGSKELFLSDHEDVQSVSTIEGKCNVHSVDGYSNLKSVSSEDYFCRFEYKHATGAFVPDHIVDTFCKCQMPYNPDQMMVQCERCSKWYHPHCIGSTKEEVEALSMFFCESCTSPDTENADKAILESEELVGRAATIGILGPSKLSEKNDFDLVSAKPVDEENGLPPKVQELFTKYNKFWSDKLEKANADLSSAVKSLLDQHSASLQVLHQKHNQDFIAELKLALSSDAEGKGAKKVNDDELTGMDHTAVHPETDATHKVALVYDLRMLEHKPPECNFKWKEIPERLSRIIKKLLDDGLTARCEVFNPAPATTKSLCDVHDAAHVQRVERLSSEIQEPISFGDMYLSKGSNSAALLAAGSVIKACDLVAVDGFESSFAIVRPPGHHVGKMGPPAGFCMFGNIASGASHLLQNCEKERILILDLDVHHGDGTQDIFYRDNRVLFFSVHRYGRKFYPGTTAGSLGMIGEGPGTGFNINVCLTQPEMTDADYLFIWEHLLLPVLNEFKPEMILISAGFDAVENDPLGDCKVTPVGFALLVEKLMSYPIVMALEGGYDLDSLSECVALCVRVLLGGRFLMCKTCPPIRQRRW